MIGWDDRNMKTVVDGYLDMPDDTSTRKQRFDVVKKTLEQYKVANVAQTEMEWRDQFISDLQMNHLRHCVKEKSCLTE